MKLTHVLVTLLFTLFCSTLLPSAALPAVQDTLAGSTPEESLPRDNEAKAPAAAVQAESVNGADENDEAPPVISDPLAPANNVMYLFNDRLYFWALKPVTQVYSHMIPEDFRIIFGNFYDNLWSPSRIINNALQLRFRAAGNELVRFLFNSLAGVGGLGDAAGEALGIERQEADFGQTLGHYGIGHGIYLVLPVLGPSSLRDGVGIAGDRLMYPLTFVSSSHLTYPQNVGIYAHEQVNITSFKIGDYESFKEAALDPYISMRDAFVQYRHKKVEESKK